MAISASFSRCLAHICGDGNLSDHYLRYNNTCQVLLDEFVRDIRIEFGEIRLTKGVGNSGTRFIQTGQKRIRSVFLNELSSFRSEAVRIPSSVLASEKRIRNEFVRAYYDDEGSPSLRLCRKPLHWTRNIHLSSKSRIMLVQISDLLRMDSGIYCNSIIKDTKGSKSWYVLSITGKGNFERFQSDIGFLHPDKKKRLEMILQSYSCTPARNPQGFISLLRKRNSHSKKVDSNPGFPHLSAVLPETIPA